MDKAQNPEYFSPQSPEEDMPVTINSETNNKYSQQEQLFNKYFPEDSLTIAKTSSKNERDHKGLVDSSFVYGEITFRSVAYIIEYLKVEYAGLINKGTFLDLGSGIGKGLLAAAYCNCFTKVVGIELLENLYEISLEMKNKYIEGFNDDINRHSDLFEEGQHMLDMQIIQGDFLKEQWINPSIILANSTCFSSELMVSLAKKAKMECPSGTIIVTFTKRLPDLGNEWELKDGFRRLMTWGIATIYVHRKK